jgi:two-component system, cell cycle response regulator
MQARSSRKKTLEFARRTPSPTSDLTSRTLLIVDDDRSNISIVRNALSPQGYQFLEASDGAQALSAIRKHRPDLIIMDVEMPGLGGVEVCRIVKANQGETGFGFIPVILMTARQGGGKIEGLELGADDYLVKPFDYMELGARVKSMLRLKALQDALVDKNRELDKANRELDRKREELLALSRTDPLTGLHNRRYFEERLNVEFARSNRYRSPLACLMLDVDHFKKVNDTYGHPFGDRVLQAVATVGTRTLRDVDMLARYGGEEMIALLPETGPQEAFRVAERFREGIEALEFDWTSPEGEKRKVKVTASIGVATFPIPGIDSSDGLLRAADDCLYGAKQAGRNRVKQHIE